MSDNVIDVRERFADLEEVYETIKDAVLARLPRSGPVMLTDDSPDGHTVKLQPLTKATQRQIGGGMQAVTLPVLPDVPVHFMSGSGITTTYGLKKGQEGWHIPAALGIDGWHQNGGVQAPGDVRQFAHADTIFIPGVRSDPNKLKGVSPNSTQTRTDDKQTLHDVSATAVTSIRQTAAHQVNGSAIQTELGGTKLHVDAGTIQHVAGKILLNC